MEDFIEKIAEIMEVEGSSITLNTIFRQACEFDSMMGFMMICMIEEEYGKRISVKDFLACKTIGDLYNYIA